MAIRSDELLRGRVLTSHYPANKASVALVRSGRAAAQKERFASRYSTSGDVAATAGEHAPVAAVREDPAETPLAVAVVASADAPVRSDTASVANEAVALGSRIFRACLLDEEAGLVTSHLAALVARFCNAPAVVAGGTWELEVEINPRILAETTLRLQLSAFRLSLRFETQDLRSKRLIYENGKELSLRLTALLGGKIDVDVTCW